jgi:hypothetical protein
MGAQREAARLRVGEGFFACGAARLCLQPGGSRAQPERSSLCCRVGAPTNVAFAHEHQALDPAPIQAVQLGPPLCAGLEAL